MLNSAHFKEPNFSQVSHSQKKKKKAPQTWKFEEIREKNYFQEIDLSSIASLSATTRLARSFISSQ